MINYNTKDDELSAIAQLAKLNDNTKIQYRIYGTVRENRPMLKLEYDSRVLTAARLEWLTKFFAGKKIEAEIKPLDEYGKYQLYCGLRRDLRNNHKLCAAIVQTIVYYLEGVLETDKPKKTKKAKHA